MKKDKRFRMVVLGCSLLTVIFSYFVAIYIVAQENTPQAIATQQQKEAVVLNTFKYDMTKNGWKLVEDVPFSGAFTPSIKEFLKPDEFRVSGTMSGTAMKQRAKELSANLGQCDAEWLLRHQKLIPKEWRKEGRITYRLVFPGTVWRCPNGYRAVPCLDWIGNQWSLCFFRLDGLGWDDWDRLISRK